METDKAGRSRAEKPMAGAERNREADRQRAGAWGGWRARLGEWRLCGRRVTWESELRMLKSWATGEEDGLSSQRLAETIQERQWWPTIRRFMAEGQIQSKPICQTIEAYLDYLRLFSKSLPLCFQRRHLLLIDQPLLLPVQRFLSEFLRRQLRYLTPKCFPTAMTPHFAFLAPTPWVQLHPSPQQGLHYSLSWLSCRGNWILLSLCLWMSVFLNLTP